MSITHTPIQSKPDQSSPFQPTPAEPVAAFGYRQPDDVVLPPETPLHMPKQQLLPKPKVLQRGFWRECGDRAILTITLPIRLTRGLYAFWLVRARDGAVE